MTAEDFVFVTDNRTDFRALYDVPGDVHPGLVFISGTDSRDHQQQRTRIMHPREQRADARTSEVGAR